MDKHKHQLQTDVGQRVRALLRLSGRTQSALADHLDVDAGSITKRIKGEVHFTITDVAETAEFFDVPVTLLFGSEDEFTTWIYEHRREWIIDLTDTATQGTTDFPWNADCRSRDLVDA